MADGNAHELFMEMALQQAQEALNRGDFPVGCVLVEDGQVVADGRRVNSGPGSNEIDHAEILALRQLIHRRGTGRDLGNVIVYSTMEPCLMCFSTLIVNNIQTMVYAYEDVMGGGTGLDLSGLNPLYAAMDLVIIPHILRAKSLALFKNFFSTPGNHYLNQSLLATYTLRQKKE